MPKNHLFNEINQLRECPYCLNNLEKNEWGSLFDLQQHYKGTVCDKCGKKIRIRVRFQGSGHDCWDSNSFFCKLVGKPKIKLLEEKVNEKK